MSLETTNSTAPQPTQPVPHICVCICTYKRPDLLRRLLETLDNQETHDAFTYSAVVADNDAARSAESLVAAIAASARISITYCIEPRQNIALVRNKALEHARGEFIAFIDDDEFPVDHWLARMLQTCRDHKASGALGPVRPHFDQPPPAWLLKGRFCERPEHATGTLMEWTKCRTGNVLFRRTVIDNIEPPFKEEFGTGGEDLDFFQRAIAGGHIFVWCNEAVAYETVPPARWTRRYMINRALLRGHNNLKLREARIRRVAESILAVPAYSLLLPFTLLCGQHVFMRYAIRFFDHLGRLLAVCRLNPVSERSM